ncbi:MAG: sialidase family protein [Opitutae bacterium]
MPRSDLSVVATHTCGWPNLTKLSNGDLLCVYFNAPSHGQIKGDLVCSIKKATQKRWKRLSVVSHRPPNGNRMHLAVGVAKNGDLLCFSSGFILKKKKFVGFAGHWLSRSTDGGISWIEETQPSIPEKLRYSIPYGRIVCVKDNILAYSCYRSQGRGKPSESWICLSYDDGRTWDRFYKLGKNDSNEVALCPLPNGNLLAAVRTHLDHHLKMGEFCFQTKRWKEKGAVTLPMQHPADLIYVGSNCILMTYGLRNRGLTGIAVRFSLDNGSTWSPPCTLHQCGDKATDLGYPSTVSIDNKGNMQTAFYTDYEPTYHGPFPIYRVLIKRWNIFDWMSSADWKIVQTGL